MGPGMELQAQGREWTEIHGNVASWHHLGRKWTRKSDPRSFATTTLSPFKGLCLGAKVIQQVFRSTEASIHNSYAQCFHD